MSAEDAEFFLGLYPRPHFSFCFTHPALQSLLSPTPWLFCSGLLWQVSQPFSVLFMTVTLYLQPCLLLLSVTKPRTFFFLLQCRYPASHCSQSWYHLPPATLQPFLELQILSSPPHLPFCGPSRGSTPPWWMLGSVCPSTLMGVLFGQAWPQLLLLLLLLPPVAQKDWKVTSCTEIVPCLFVV